MISIPSIEKPIASLTRLIPVAILCGTCRLSTQSVVSIFDSAGRANLRLKLAVASIGGWSFLRGGCRFFSLAIPYKSISRAGVSESDEKSEKIFLIR
jgi:hypothetical protein